MCPVGWTAGPWFQRRSGTRHQGEGRPSGQTPTSYASPYHKSRTSQIDILLGCVHGAHEVLQLMAMSTVHSRTPRWPAPGSTVLRAPAFKFRPKPARVLISIRPAIERDAPTAGQVLGGRLPS